jgi:dTDP-alpha-D-glucuronic acid decarboxylase
MARILVTGGCGFVGGHLAEKLARSGHDVTIFDIAPARAARFDAIRYVEGDVRDEPAVAKAITPGTDIVYHMSAMVGVDRYLSVPEAVVEVNLIGTRNVLRQARKTETKVVIASTSEIYGKNPAVPWREDADRVLGETTVDRWSYSTSKALAEHLTFANIRQYGLRATIVRYFNVYGPRQRPAYIISRSVHRALRGLTPEVYDSGDQTRCFTYIDDAIEGTILAGTSAEADGECFNIGSDQETTVSEVVSIICELSGAPAPLGSFNTYLNFGARYQDILRRVPDVSKARAVLGFEASTPLHLGLRHTVEWGRRNGWWLELRA